MNLSYSLLSSFDDCQFRTKVEKLDRAFERDDDSYTHEYGRPRPWVEGNYAHDAQQALLEGEPVGTPLRAYLQKDEERVEVEERAWKRAMRWWTWMHKHADDLLAPAPVIQIDRKHVVPLPNPIGVFTHLVVKPDLFRADSHATIADWKWRREFSDYTALELDEQTALYQYGYQLMGWEVNQLVWVEGLLKEPTYPQITRKGKVSRAHILCDPDVFREAVRGNKQDPAEYEDLIATFKPFFQKLEVVRSRKAVRAIWESTIVPKAFALSAAIEGLRPFARRLGWPCNRCWLREECLAGITGGSQYDALNHTRGVYATASDA